MSVPLDAQCIECHLQRNLRTARKLGTGEQATAFAKDLLRLYLTVPDDAASPWLGPATSDLFTKHYGLDADRFREEKALSNRYVLERLDTIRSRVTAAEDPLLAALRFAILGNYIDFSALQDQVSFGKLDELLDGAASMELDMEAVSALRGDLSRGRRLLYLTDNAGEIGFDRIFAEQLSVLYPDLQITFCVRGAPAMNDATREDAALVGIPFPVIDNGNRIAGTQLDQLSDDAKQAMREADVIIAKGQGNTETMLGCGYNVYYAFLVKCPRFMQRFDRPMLTPMLVRERASQ